MGWSLIAIGLIALLVNFGYKMREVGKKLVLRFKVWYIKIKKCFAKKPTER